MMFSAEWLDISEILLGINKKLVVENPEHQFVIMDCFDIVEDKD